MTPRAKISFIVPVYKVENNLDRCVESLKKQRGCESEIILVDDGSPDRCPQMCDAYAAADERIRVIHQENLGLSQARNAGLKIASGEYVWFVDSDDYIEAGACRKLVEAMERGADIVAFGFYTTYAAAKPGAGYVSLHGNISNGERLRPDEFIIRTIRDDSFFVQSWTYAYKRTFLLENDLFFFPGILHEDIQRVPGVLLAAKSIEYVDESLYIHEIRPDTITTTQNASKAIHDIKVILKEWKDLFDRIGDPELQSWLYHELVVTYIFSSYARGLTGWWLEGMNFAFAISHAKSMKLRARVVKYEVISAFRRVPRAPGSSRK